MKKYTRIGVCALASLALAGVLCASPSPARNGNAKHAQTAAAQSVSGKIASVSKSSFTLTVAAEKVSNSSAQSQAQGTPKTMTFMVDNNTTIDGKLQVGANADVTYREEGGNYIALSVRVGQ